MEIYIAIVENPKFETIAIPFASESKALEWAESTAIPENSSDGEVVREDFGEDCKSFSADYSAKFGVITVCHFLYGEGKCITVCRAELK